MGTELPFVDAPADLARLHREMVEMNEALILGSVRQHELTEAAESLNAQLQLEIAAREKTTRELAEKARLLDLTEDAIIVRDVEGQISYWNHGAEVLYGWSREEAIGKTTHALLQTEFPTPMEHIAQELSTNGRWTGELVHTTRDSQRITVLARKTLDRDREGNPAAVLQTLTDITERKKLEQQSLRAQRMESVGTLAGGIAHDFNNLLTGIMGNAALCRLQLHRSNPLHENLEKIQTTGQRAADLCKQMLAYAGKGKTAHAVMDLSAVVWETVRLVNLSVSKKVVVRFDLASGLRPVEGDPAQLQQVVMNLVINASEAIGERPGEIRITTGKETMEHCEFASAVLAQDMPGGEYLFVQVRDTGDGMPQEMLAKIFDPFFTTKFTGRGLGLAATTGIVRAHNGAVFVESAPGKGSTFRILLPASTRVLEEIPSPAPMPEPAQLHGFGKVLLVDDEEEVRSVLRYMLEFWGFEVVEARNGREALKICTECSEPFRLVLMDVTMPDMNGVETFEELHRLYPRLPVLLVSGYSEQEVAVRFGDASGSDFLQKPFLPSHLEEKLRRLLA